MKIGGSPMPELRAKAEGIVNVYFDRQARPHLDQEYALKRQEAQRYLDGHGSQWIESEAQLLRGPAKALAKSIVAKDDVVMQRALARRKAVLAVRNAKDREDVNVVLRGLGLNDV
jgi:hypothetical protein